MAVGKNQPLEDTLQGLNKFLGCYIHNIFMLQLKFFDCTYILVCVCVCAMCAVCAVCTGAI